MAVRTCRISKSCQVRGNLNTLFEERKDGNVQPFQPLPLWPDTSEPKQRAVCCLRKSIPWVLLDATARRLHHAELHRPQVGQRCKELVGCGGVTTSASIDTHCTPRSPQSASKLRSYVAPKGFTTFSVSPPLGSFRARLCSANLPERSDSLNP